MTTRVHMALTLAAKQQLVNSLTLSVSLMFTGWKLDLEILPVTFKFFWPSWLSSQSLTMSLCLNGAISNSFISVSNFSSLGCTFKVISCSQKTSINILCNWAWAIVERGRESVWGKWSVVMPAAKNWDKQSLEGQSRLSTWLLSSRLKRKRYKCVLPVGTTGTACKGSLHCTITWTKKVQRKFLDGRGGYWEQR